MAREVMLPQIFANARFEKVQSISQSVNQTSIVTGRFWQPACLRLATGKRLLSLQLSCLLLPNFP